VRREDHSRTKVLPRTLEQGEVMLSMLQHISVAWLVASVVLAVTALSFWTKTDKKQR